MPVHDWTRVTAGIFHHFHLQWLAALSTALNDGRMPANYYALAEQIAGNLGPDVLTLEIDTPNGAPAQEAPGADSDTAGGPPVALAEPRVRFTAETEMDQYVLKQNTLVIHHTSGDRVVALVEIVSAGNKASRHGIRTFVEKAASALYRGYHLLILDLQPPGPRDPHGIHGAIWEEIADDSFRLPADKPLTLVAYRAGLTKRAYIEPVAVDDVLPDMPLYLREGLYVNVPLEEAYRAAWQTVPQRWRRVLEAPTA
jgi:hypothetical protein